MRARAFVILWVGAAVAATTIAWQGVSIVDSQVISPAPAISTDRSSSTTIPIETASTTSPFAIPTPTASAQPERLDLDLSGLADATSKPDDAPGPEAGEPTPTTASPPSDTERTTQPTPRSTPEAQPTKPDSPTPTVPPRSTPVPTSPPTTPTAAPQPTATAEPTPTVQPAQVLTFELIGGTASVSFAEDQIHVLWATPEPGFSAEISNSGPGQRVEFHSDDGESRLDVWWDAGPQWSIDEDHD